VLIANGVYRPDLDPEVLPALLAGGYERLAREMIKRPRRPDIEGWVLQARDLYMRGLLTDDAREVFDREVRRDRRVSESGPLPAVRAVGDEDEAQGRARER